MQSHPIENIMRTAMEQLKLMLDVNTIVGDPVRMDDGSLIIPVSKVSFGFVAGGGEYGLGEGNKRSDAALPLDASQDARNPFGGGAGAGASVNPMAFLVVGKNNVRVMPVYYNTTYDRIIEAVPQLLHEVQQLFSSDEKKQDGNGQRSGKNAQTAQSS